MLAQAERADLKQARLMALALPLALLGGAIGSQLIGGLVPCEMCIWQRWPHAVAIVFALAAFFMKARRWPVAMAALAIAVSGAIGVAHVGVETGLVPPFTDCASAGPVESLDDLFAQPTVRCDEVQWSLLGISMAGWNAILSLSGALVIAWKLKKA